MGGLNPLATTEANDFTGLRTNADPGDLGATGAQEQTNLVIIAKGMLQGRLGIRPGSFANGVGPVVQPVISMQHYAAPGADWVLFEQADGSIRAGKAFS
jgi:hypothetical protein